MPRWGGSYEEAEAFIAKSKAEGVPETVVDQLQAILHDDRGHSLETQGNHAAAVAEFERALEFGKKVNKAFQEDFLKNAWYYVCAGPNAAKYCL